MAGAGEWPAWLSEYSGGVRLRCRVQPRASRTALCGVLGDALKVALTAPPVEGKANTALETFFAGLFGVSRGRVRVASGAASRGKMIEIDGVGGREALALLEAKLESGRE